KPATCRHEAPHVHRPGSAAHGNADEPEPERRSRGVEHVARALPSRARVTQDADEMPARGLPTGDVEDVAKEAADRRTEHMDDSQWPDFAGVPRVIELACGQPWKSGVQNHRSL